METNSRFLVLGDLVLNGQSQLSHVTDVFLNFSRQTSLSYKPYALNNTQVLSYKQMVVRNQPISSATFSAQTSIDRFVSTFGVFEFLVRLLNICRH